MKKRFGLPVYETKTPTKPGWYFLRLTWPTGKPVESIIFWLAPERYSNDVKVEYAGPLDRAIDEARVRQIEALPASWRPGSSNAEVYGIPSHVDDGYGDPKPLEGERFISFDDGTRAYFPES